MDFDKLQSKASKWMKIADAMAWYLIKRFAKREIVLNLLTSYLKEKYANGHPDKSFQCYPLHFESPPLQNNNNKQTNRKTNKQTETKQNQLI